MSDEKEFWYTRPVFFVADGEAALAFYEGLGFTMKWRHDEDGRLVAAQVDRAGAELILNLNPERAGGGRVFVSLNPGETARSIASFADGVEVRDGFWGMPVKIVRDSDGNELFLYDDELKAS